MRGVVSIFDFGMTAPEKAALPARAAPKFRRTGRCSLHIIDPLVASQTPQKPWRDRFCRVCSHFEPKNSAKLGWVRLIPVIARLPYALVSAMYKGVLFSTTSQPGWRDARWLGAYLTDSAITIGCAAMLAILAGNLLVRWAIVMLPHEPRPGE